MIIILYYIIKLIINTLILTKYNNIYINYYTCHLFCKIRNGQNRNMSCLCSFIIIIDTCKQKWSRLSNIHVVIYCNSLYIAMTKYSMVILFLVVLCKRYTVGYTEFYFINYKKF